MDKRKNSTKIRVMFTLFADNVPSQEQIELVRGKVQRVAKACHPKRILLIGSASRGEMKTTSDVDLVVILKSGQDDRLATRSIAMAREGDAWPQDVLVVSEEEFRSKSQVGGIYWIAKTEGIEVYPNFELIGEVT